MRSGSARQARSLRSIGGVGNWRERASASSDAGALPEASRQSGSPRAKALRKRQTEGSCFPKESRPAWARAGRPQGEALEFRADGGRWRQRPPFRSARAAPQLSPRPRLRPWRRNPHENASVCPHAVASASAESGAERLDGGLVGGEAIVRAPAEAASDQVAPGDKAGLDGDGGPSGRRDKNGVGGHATGPSHLLIIHRRWR